MMAVWIFPLMAVKHGLRLLFRSHSITMSRLTIVYLSVLLDQFKISELHKGQVALRITEFEPANGMELAVVKQAGLFQIGPIQILFMPVSMAASSHFMITERGRHGTLESIPTCRLVMIRKI